MCGIAGIIGRADGTGAPARAQLLRMAAALRHRGPDQTGIAQLGRAGLAHTRLSIIDASGGRQPHANADGTVWMVYNGEVYNYVELREELRSLGRTFTTQSDTEVVLRAYEEWGAGAFLRFNGQFAVAIWDAPRERLVLARDRLGVRPLYVCAHGGTLTFASEVKAIFAGDVAIPRALDPAGLDETFTFWTPVAPRTVFQGIEELRPGYVRTYDARGMEEHPYWSPVYPRDGVEGFQGSLEDAVDAVRAEMVRATSMRMLRADVPVGAYLSGGLDSSLVVALARRATGARFSTFSLRFDQPSYDESSFQRLVARELGTDHHELTVTSAEIAQVFPDVVVHAERPLLRTAPAPLFLLSRLVEAAGIKVVLTGEGADEMFAGYDLFREAKVRRFWARQPASSSRPRLLGRIYPYLDRSPVAQEAMARRFFGVGLDEAGTPGFAHGTRWRTTGALKRLFAAPMQAAVRDRDSAALLLDGMTELAGLSPLAQDQLIEIRTLLSGYLLSAQGDRMLMANSVEGRFPFLDNGVMALANALPPSFMLRVLDEKHVLKRVCEGLVPSEVIARTKQPYRAPDAETFVGPEAPEWVADALAERAVTQAGVFDPRAVAQLHGKCTRVVADGKQLSNADNMALVGILSTQLLHRGFVERSPAPFTTPISSGAPS